MRKKAYFIVESIISFLFSIYSIIVSKETVKITIDSLKEMRSDFPIDLWDRIINIYEKSGVRLTIFCALIVIFSSICLFIFACNNTLLKNKGFVITFSVLTFLFTDNVVIQFLGIASFIIILCIKRKTPEDYPKKTKKEIPKLELKKTTIKDKFFSVILLIIYFSQFIWDQYLPDKYSVVITLKILFYILMLILSILVFMEQFKYNFKVFKENLKSYIKFILSKLGFAYIVLFICSFFSMLITHKVVSNNQQAVESLPIYFLIPAVVIYAPVVEEIIFRGVIRKFIKNNVVFIIVSALVFGILHTISESSFINIIIMSLPYVSLGACSAYIYTKTNNIFSNIAMHMLFNLISTIFIVLI